MRGARLTWWLQPLGVIVGAVALLAALRPGAVGAGIIVALGLVLAWWISPLHRSPGVAHAEAAHRAQADGAVVVYWRPGCPFCARLRRGLGGQRHAALWVNIWADEDAAAFVRSVNDGNETVPTVVVGASGVWTNPDPKRVREALAASR